tara:strand:+ start:1492 stop:2220 length:729 start_codon:yes stop_codon:yes gene_type:complete
MVTNTKEGLTSVIRSIAGEYFDLGQGQEILEADILQAIDLTVRTFSRSIPREIVEDEVGDGGKYYPLTNLASWVNDFSRIVSIDYDSGSRVGSDEQPRFLDKNNLAWSYYRDATVRYLFFPGLAPTSSITFRVTYTALHTLSETTSTVPSQYENAVIYLTVSHILRFAQVRMEQGTGGQGSSEFTGFRNKGSGFGNIAEHYEQLYIKEMGGADGVPAALATREFDMTFAHGEQYLFHGGQLR